MALKLDVKPNDLLQIGSATIKLISKSGKIARLEITAPAEVEINLIKDDSETSLSQEAREQTTLNAHECLSTEDINSCHAQLSA